jgi:hypothetical protein
MVTGQPHFFASFSVKPTKVTSGKAKIVPGVFTIDWLGQAWCEVDLHALLCKALMNTEEK